MKEKVFRAIVNVNNYLINEILNEKGKKTCIEIAVYDDWSIKGTINEYNEIDFIVFYKEKIQGTVELFSLLHGGKNPIPPYNYLDDDEIYATTEEFTWDYLRKRIENNKLNKNEEYFNDLHDTLNEIYVELEKSIKEPE